MKGERVPATERIELRSGPRLFGTLTRRLRRHLEGEGYPETDRELVLMAVSEAVANVLEHGYGGREEMPLNVEVRDLRGGRIEVTILDRAPAFAVAGVPAADFEQLARRCAVRGRGIALMRLIAESVDSRPRSGGGNRWTLIFDPRRLATIVEEHHRDAA